MPSNPEGATASRRPAPAGGGHGPERVTVNLTARTSRALEHVTDITGDSKTDVINRAIQVYDYFEEIMAGGGTVFFQRTEDSTPERLRFY
jgi:hypothetical protein